MIAYKVLHFCTQRGIDSEDIFSQNSTSKVSITRMMIWWYLHEEHLISYPKLSRMFGRSVRMIKYGTARMRHELKFMTSIGREYVEIVKTIEDGIKPAL